jgi:hypothetical protein
VNPTALETLERRLDATRRALAGEQERRRNAASQVQRATEAIREHEAVIRDLQDALDELRPAGRDPLDVPCHSCGAKAGEPCQSPTREPLDAIHATRGAPA